MCVSGVSMSEQPLLLSHLAFLPAWNFEREARYRVRVVDTLTDLCAAVKSRPLNAANRTAINRARQVVNELYVGTFTEDAERLLDYAERAMDAVRKNNPGAADILARMNASLPRIRLNVLADRPRPA